MKVFGEKEVKIQLQESTGPQGIPGPAGPRGEAGKAGFSPMITVTAIEGGHRVKITDAGGTKYFDVMDGVCGGESSGEDGFSPQVDVTMIVGGHRVMITDAGGTKSFDVKNGEDGRDGSDGHTPVKGEDYWTAADKTEMVSDVLAALPNASGVNF